MAVISKASDSPCNSRVDHAVRTSLAPWIAPVCLVHAVPSIACWFLASRKQVGRLAAHVHFLRIPWTLSSLRLMPCCVFFSSWNLWPKDLPRDARMNVFDIRPSRNLFWSSVLPRWPSEEYDPMDFPIEQLYISNHSIKV